MQTQEDINRKQREIDWEDRFLLPASGIAKLLGVETSAVPKYLVRKKSKNVGNYNKWVDYYDGRLIFGIYNEDKNLHEEFTEEEIKKAEEALSLMKLYKTKFIEKVYVADVQYRVYNDNRYVIVRHKNIEVTESNCYYNFLIDGEKIIKRKDIAGTIVKKRKQCF